MESDRDPMPYGGAEIADTRSSSPSLTPPPAEHSSEAVHHLQEEGQDDYEETLASDRIKLQRSRVPLIIILLGMAWLAVSLAALSLGLQKADHILTQQTKTACVRFRHAECRFRSGVCLDVRLEMLQAQPLPKRLFETHEDCLARAITVGVASYGALPYHSRTDIINDTVDWAELSCAKLHFTPEVWRPVDFLRLAWTMVVDKTVRTYHAIKANGVDGVNKVASWVGTKTSRKCTGGRSWKNETKRPAWQNRPRMPSDFDIDCTPGHICRIRYKGSLDRDMGMASAASGVHIAHAGRAIEALWAFKVIFSRATSFIRAVGKYVLLPLELLLLAATTGAVFCYHSLPDLEHLDEEHNSRSVPPQKLGFVLGLGLLTCTMLCLSVMPTSMEKASTLLLGLATICLAAIINMMYTRVLINDISFGFSSLVWSFEELHDIWGDQDTGIPTSDNEQSKTKAEAEEVVGRRTSTATDARPWFRKQTSLQEDIQHEREAMHDEEIVRAGDASTQAEHDAKEHEDVGLSDSPEPEWTAVEADEYAD